MNTRDAFLDSCQYVWHIKTLCIVSSKHKIPCFTPVCYALFPAFCQIATLLNLHPFVFVLRIFGLLLFPFIQVLFFSWQYTTWFTRILFRPTFSGTQLGRKAKTLVYVILVLLFIGQSKEFIVPEAQPKLS